MPVTNESQTVAEPHSLLDLLDAREAVREAWMDLDATVKQIDEVRTVMNNIDVAFKSIEQFGTGAVPVLNTDCGLESLLDVSTDLVTVDKAVEGLGEAAANAWQKLKELLKKLIEKIKGLFSKRDVVHKATIANLENIGKKTEEAKAEVKARPDESKVDTDVIELVDGRDMTAIGPYIAKCAETVKWFSELLDRYIKDVMTKDPVIVGAKIISGFTNKLADTKWNGLADDIGVEFTRGFDTPTKNGSKGMYGVVGVVFAAQCFRMTNGTRASLGYDKWTAEKIAALIAPAYDAFNARNGKITAKLVGAMDKLYASAPRRTGDSATPPSTEERDAFRIRLVALREASYMSNGLIQTLETLVRFAEAGLRTSLLSLERARAKQVPFSYLRSQR